MKGEGMDKVRDALVELEDAINAEGFGCACMPDVKCATCKARDLMSKWVRPSFEKLREALSAQPAEPVSWEGTEGWEALAWQLCADENGEDACNELVWEGGAIPEPWGDRWLKYEGEAKRMIALVQRHASQPAPSVPAAPEFCCEHAWSAAKQLAWKERDLRCDCDHNEYCQKCFPLEFRAGGKWDKYAAAPHPAAKGAES